MSVRDDVRELLEGVPEERLEDVRTYLEHLRYADCAWKSWQHRHGGSETDERIRSLPHPRRRRVAFSLAEEAHGVEHRLASGRALKLDRA